jgi:signal transduction histidine kinase
MRERAEAIGARLVIDTPVGGGTTVELDVPLSTEGVTQ